MLGGARPGADQMLGGASRLGADRMLTGDADAMLVESLSRMVKVMLGLRVLNARMLCFVLR